MKNEKESSSSSPKPEEVGTQDMYWCIKNNFIVIPIYFSLWPSSSCKVTQLIQEMEPCFLTATHLGNPSVLWHEW